MPKSTGYLGRDMRAWAQALPRAGDTVDGRTVRPHVPNMTSISATLTEPRILAGIREVPLSAFDYEPGRPDERTLRLADEIEASEELNPLIVAVNEQGPYIIEGGHRLDALWHLRAQSMPAVVVLDEEALGPTPMFHHSTFGLALATTGARP